MEVQSVMLVPNTLDTECLLQAFQEAHAAKVNHDKARDAYQGYSWGYHGHQYVQAMEAAALELQNRLARYVTANVDARLRELGLIPKE